MVINSPIKNKNLNFFKVVNQLSQINFLMTNSHIKISIFNEHYLIYFCCRGTK